MNTSLYFKKLSLRAFFLILATVTIIFNGCQSAPPLPDSEVSQYQNETKNKKKANSETKLTGIPTQRDFDNKKYAWMLRHIVESYKSNRSGAHGRDNAAIEFLIDACRYITHQKSPSDLNEIEALGRKLISDGCDDPLVHMWYSIIMQCTGKLAEAKTIMDQIFHGRCRPVQSFSYPNVQYFYAFRSYAEVFHQLDPKKMKMIQSVHYCALRYLYEAVTSGEFSGDEFQIAYRLLADTYNEPAEDKRWGIFLRGLSSFHGEIDPWLKNLVAGRAEIESAWKSRGADVASKVTEKGWEGFKKHLALAEEFLTKAWKLHPEYPEAATQMITVAMGGQCREPDAERIWFERAVSAQMDYIPAYSKYHYSQTPRWGGNYDRMAQFGLACLETKRFDTQVPLFYLLSLRDIAREMPSNNWRLPFRVPEVNENLNYLMDELLKNPFWKRDRKRILAQKAIIEAWCGNYRNAHRLLKKVGTDVDFNRGFFNRGLSWNRRQREVVEAEIRAFTGPQKDRLEKAEIFCFQGRFDQAAASFEQAMEDCKADKDIFAYLRDRIAYLKMGYSAEESLVTDLWTPLHLAASKGHNEVVKFLVENGADLKAVDSVGFTPLHRALIKKNIDAASFLIDSGSDVHTACNHGQRPILLAAGECPAETVKKLLIKGADPNVKDIHDQTPLFMAAKHGYVEKVRLLIEYNANVNERSRMNWTPLLAAAAGDYAEVAKILLENGADPNIGLKNGITPLKVALRNRSVKVYRILSQLP